MRFKMQQKLFSLLCGLLLALFAGACFYHLGHYSFWQDEAETAFLAKSILARGLPYSLVDGIWITQFHGLESRADHLWFFTPWLPFYLCAGSFKIFGFSEWAGRLPFALAGFLSAALLWRLTWRWTRSRAMTFLTLLFYTTNVSLIIYTRQCKYYPFYLLSFLLVLYGLLKWRENRKGFGWVLFGFLGAFHCNYLTAGLLFIGFGIFCLFTGEGKLFRGLFWKIALGVGIFFGPFLLLAPMGERMGIVAHAFSASIFLSKCGAHIYYWNNQVFPLLLGLGLFWKRPKGWKFFGILWLCSWLGLPLLSHDEFRYDIHLLPLFCFLIAFLLVSLYRRNRALAAVLFGFLFFTDIFQNLPDAIHEKSFSKLFYKEEWVALKNYFSGNFPDPLKKLPLMLESYWKEGEYAYLNHDQLPWEWYSKIPLAYIGEPSKTPPKNRPLNPVWTDRHAISWWIGPHWIKNGNGPYIGREELKPIVTIETGIPVANWNLNEPIRYKHFLKRFTQPPEETIQFLRVQL